MTIDPSCEKESSTSASNSAQDYIERVLSNQRFIAQAIQEQKKRREMGDPFKIKAALERYQLTGKLA